MPRLERWPSSLKAPAAYREPRFVFQNPNNSLQFCLTLFPGDQMPSSASEDTRHTNGTYTYMLQALAYMK